MAIISLCFFLCGAGTYLASTVHEKREPQEMNAIPVKNRDVVRRIWIVAACLWPPQIGEDNATVTDRRYSVGIVTRSSDVAFLRGPTLRSCNRAGIRKNSPGTRSTLAHRSEPVRQQTIAN